MADIKRMPKLYMLNFFWLSTPTCQKHGFRIRNSVDMTADDRAGVFLVVFVFEIVFEIVFVFVHVFEILPIVQRK